MSGPKVIRIVTRDEVIALCEDHMARLDTMLEEWIRVGLRNDAVNEAEIATAKGRREILRELLIHEQFLDMQNLVPKEVAFLKADLQFRLANAIAAEAQARTKRRRVAAAAASVMAALSRTSKDVPVKLLEALQDIASGDRENVSAIKEGIDLLSNSNTAGKITERQQALAGLLKEEDDHQSYGEWLTTQPVSGDDHVLARLDRQLAEISVLAEPGETDALEQRIRDIAQGPPAHRPMIVDSLELDIAQTLTRIRQEIALRKSLDSLGAELARIDSPAAEVLKQEIYKAKGKGPSAQLSDLIGRSERMIKLERDHAAARARRDAVLAGLASLGYEVSEGMATAWVRDGRVVLRNVAQTGYGVELSGDAKSARIQVRAVAFGQAGAVRDSSRDKDVETIWCQALGRLGAQIGSDGGGITIEKARAAGTVPLKVVELPSGSLAEDQTREGPATQSRKI